MQDAVYYSNYLIMQFAETFSSSCSEVCVL